MSTYKDYEKIDDRILLNCGGTMGSAPHDDPEKAAKRNRHSRVTLIDGDIFSVVVRTGGKEYVVVEGEAKAKLGKMFSLFVRVRAEEDVDEPVAPVEPEEP